MDMQVNIVLFRKQSLDTWINAISIWRVPWRQNGDKSNNNIAAKKSDN